MSIFDSIIESSKNITDEIIQLLDLTIQFLKTIGRTILQMDKPIQILILLSPILPLFPVILNFIKDL